MTDKQKKIGQQKFVGTPDEMEFITEDETEINLPQCTICEHLIDPEAQTCEAFPKGIPDDIFIGDVAHDKSMRDDNGIIFDPIEEVLVL